nr:endo-1,4-beta-xylanase [Roseomonas acroporae]
MGLRRGVTFGTAVQGGWLDTEPAYAAMVAAEAALLVPEWEGKWSALQPQEGRFDFAPLDRILRFGLRHRRQVRGHALVWHQAMPDWLLTALAEGPQRARAVLEAHIATVLDRTRRQVRDWDVVNEVVADVAGSDTPQAGPGELRDSPWLRALGPGYIDLALRLARERDATLRLVLNDYGTESDEPWSLEKRRRLMRLVRGLLERGVPLDAVGIQGHLQMSERFSPEGFRAHVEELRSLGLAVLITELDVREAPRIAPDIAQRDAAVAERVQSFVAAGLAGGVRTVLTWGLSDRESWLLRDPDVARRDGAQHRGLPFDEERRRRPMWQALADAFATLPER